MNVARTLARTALLIALDVLPDLAEHEIVAGLTNVRVRLVADAQTARSPTGQSALTTAAIGLAQSGARVQLDIPDAPRLNHPPPLTPGSLAESLRLLAADLLFPIERTSGMVDVAFVFGSAPPGAAREVIRVQGDEWGCQLGQDCTAGVTGSLPFGGLLAGVAVAAEGLRAALRAMAERTGTRTLGEHGLAQTPSLALALPHLPHRHAELGQVDVISGGAITNAALFALLRWPEVSAQLRIFDEDLAEESNLNRYALLRRSQLEHLKAHILSDYGTATVTIEPVPARFDEAAAPLWILRDRVLVGVDHIPSRWLVARQAPGWVCIAGTTHFSALVSEHVPSGPCGGCLHPYDEADDGDIPTVSFVSYLAGFLQAYCLLAQSYGLPPALPTLAAPFNLGAARAITRIGMTARPDCPVGCAASKK